ncbi:DinB family protein [Arthrobacter sp. JSM 101049]|uniref:DinB family protein n=1 Tax=Arthrobacter sp. JSM 101049 TaxID=929097 RepID=UPI003569ABC9
MLTHKEVLTRYLQNQRDALLWKVDGLDEYDLRRPLTPTGTNLLGLLKHLASIEYGYFGDVFGRPAPEPMPWMEDDAEDNADMFASADESAEGVIGFYHRACRHADETIAALDLDAEGFVPWWGPDRGHTTLQLLLVHMIAETARHAGHADIVREAIDGAAGLSARNGNLPPGDAGWWESHRDRLQSIAEQFRD